MSKIRVGFALCGSFCTFEYAKAQMKNLIDKDFDVLPIMSFNAYSTDTRFGKAQEHIEEIESMCNRKIVATLTDAEPIGPKKMTDILHLIRHLL